MCVCVYVYIYIYAYIISNLLVNEVLFHDTALSFMHFRYLFLSFLKTNHKIFFTKTEMIQQYKY